MGNDHNPKVATFQGSIVLSTAFGVTLVGFVDLLQKLSPPQPCV